MLFVNALAFLGAAATATAAAVAPAAAAPSSLAVAEKIIDGKVGLVFDSSETSVKEKRATEGIHFVNCQGNGYAYSDMVYCADDSNCNYKPAANNVCRMKTDGLFTWEGKTASCGFSSGVTYSYTLPANAWSQQQYTRVGSGNNGYRTWSVYHDQSPSGRAMYNAGNGVTCSSVYYSL